MRRKLVGFLLLFLALAPGAKAAGEYRVLQFNSQIELLQNTDLDIVETISAEFLAPKHGIYRIIPVKYQSNAKRIDSKLKVISVTDESGTPYTYIVGRSGNNVSIKIGDVSSTITGRHIYKIHYKVENILQSFADHDELYWNVTGSEWDVPLEKVTANVNSKFAKINRQDCFSGLVGSTSRNCSVEIYENSALASSHIATGQGSDFTLVLGFSPDNQLQFPSLLEQIWEAGYLWYLLMIIPGVGMGIIWWKKGRDLKFIGDNIYYSSEDSKTELANPWARKYLPNVYGPINGLTPSQVGTIIDQKVDLDDVIGEIIELARLKFLEIREIKTKKFLGEDQDYHFVISDKSTAKLRDYQVRLLNSLKKSQYLVPGSTNIYALSKMKNKFYTDLNQFKSDLYKNLNGTDVFDGQPEAVKGLWMVLVFISQFVLTIYVAPFLGGLAVAAGVLSGVTGLIFAYYMPRRTARGYSYYRQLEGLKYFIDKGKWRYEIAEKRLFIEEILPLAISLGVVNKLSQDMEGLALKPPEYLSYVPMGHWSNFQSKLNSTLPSVPSSSRSSGWSGGSGFSGGSSGGGGGGGGGGSW